MERIGILVVSYGSRGAAIIDALCRSEKFDVNIFVVDKQKNPFNVSKAKIHTVIPDLNIKKICKFAKKNEKSIDFGIVGPEKPIILGVRDLIEAETEIPIICPTKKYAIEGSKVYQRSLFQEIAPEVNPRFKVFNSKEHGSFSNARLSLEKWLERNNNQVAVKPDRPVSGKGVGVWGDHFKTREQIIEHFRVLYEQGPVVVEEKVEGEESSFHAFSDGKHIVPIPETRDYKRAFENDEGPNTGGMGSYKDVGDRLPFMTSADREKEIKIVQKIFRKLKGKGSNPGLRGIPTYTAFVHTADGQKIFENNSRPGDPEIMNLLPILKEDFVDLCFKIISGNLRHIRFEKKSTVVTYKVPLSYGGYKDVFSGLTTREEATESVDLSKVNRFVKNHEDQARVYPGSMEIRDDRTYALKSRAVATVGIGDDLESARNNSLEAIQMIRGGSLWYRNDIASKEHIERSIEHMKRLRGN